MIHLYFGNFLLAYAKQQVLSYKSDLHLARGQLARLTLYNDVKNICEENGWKIPENVSWHGFRVFNRILMDLEEDAINEL